jgi:hypothetical protein
VDAFLSSLQLGLEGLALACLLFFAPGQHKNLLCTGKSDHQSKAMDHSKKKGKEVATLTA